MEIIKTCSLSFYRSVTIPQRKTPLDISDIIHLAAAAGDAGAAGGDDGPADDPGGGAAAAGRVAPAADGAGRAPGRVGGGAAGGVSV